MLQSAHVARSPQSRPGLSIDRHPAPARPATHSCATCAMRRACLAGNLGTTELDDFAGLARLKRTIRRGAALYRAGDALDSLYLVRTGGFKETHLARHGEEKVTAFHLPGDALGLEAISNGIHHADAVALEDSEVCVVSFDALQRMASAVPALQQTLLRALSCDIARDDGLMLLLGGLTAGQRLAAFLLSLSRRYSSLGYSAERFVLRMTREDIGSYLGLTVETVSRLFTRFQRDGLIAVHLRDVEVRDMEGLRDTFEG